MVGREVEQVSETHERYKPRWIITTWREKGRIWDEGYHVSTGVGVKVKLRGRIWGKVKWPDLPEDDEQSFWNEFAAYKAQNIKQRHYKRTGRKLEDNYKRD